MTVAIVTPRANPADTLGAIAERQACQLLTALAAAGAPGLLVVGRIPSDDPDAAAGPHRAWPFVSLRVRTIAVRIYCMPTSTGTVLLLESPSGVSRCLSTWGAPVTAFGAAALAVAQHTASA